LILNRSHIPWAFFVLCLTAVLGAVYAELFVPGVIPHYVSVPPWLGRFPLGHRSIAATPLGVLYGTAAFLLFIFAVLLGVRKKKRHWRIGRAETWLRAHIWMSILTIPLVVFHCGFHPGSAMTSGLLVLYAIVMISGFYGLALQQFIPRLMKQRLKREVVYGEIPFFRKSLLESAGNLRNELKTSITPRAQAQGVRATGAAEALEEEYDEVEQSHVAVLEMLDSEVLPYLRSRKGKGCRLGEERASDTLFRLLEGNVTKEFRPRVAEIQRWCDERRQMDLQARYQHWLHYWLLVHVPLSFLLLIWTAWHAVAGLYFY
jgi:hypothetical protein